MFLNCKPIKPTNLFQFKIIEIKMLFFIRCYKVDDKEKMV